ncbi:hypothetical protein LEP1GSC067_2041 [Leptospira interrogans serovar Lora str. TE 1992]|uniref:Uncharacterized protein n=1 Tax=Leptospira interrogans serovar Lora str. TE 1992 TaxID=1193028 RepID=M3CTU5_LEPIR|nr:hypothetical protein LEP1GSC067_2041 [Leptospira interrogans serovar Lora str. TE 1992]
MGISIKFKKDLCPIRFLYKVLFCEFCKNLKSIFIGPKQKRI